MGLDNGIYLKIAKNKEYPKFAPKSDYKEEGYSEDICYWRKCWGIRDAIIRVLDPKGKQEYLYKIEAEDVPAIMRAIASFLDKSTWEEEGSSIWEYDEIKDNLINQLIKLPLLKYYLEENKEDECYFYDSY